MSLTVGVLLETAAGESRVAVTPETAKKLIAQGHKVRMQSGAGISASVPDDAYAAVGVELVDATTAWGSDLVLKVRAPEPADAAAPVAPRPSPAPDQPAPPAR